MFERFASPARRAIGDAIAEAALRGDQRAGTEHLLLALLQQPLPFDRSLLGPLDAPVPVLRAALDEMDRDALAAVGVDVEEVAALELVPAGEWPVRRGRPSITAGVRDVLVGAQRAAGQRRDGLGRRISVEHLFLEITALPPQDTAIRLLRQLGADPMEVRAAVVETLRRSA